MGDGVVDEIYSFNCQHTMI